jgi:hypothetical protein
MTIGGLLIAAGVILLALTLTWIGGWIPFSDHEIEDLRNLRSHAWLGARREFKPGPYGTGSYEWVRYCSACGMEDTCEDSMPPCPGRKEVA